MGSYLRSRRRAHRRAHNLPYHETNTAAAIRKAKGSNGHTGDPGGPLGPLKPDERPISDQGREDLHAHRGKFQRIIGPHGTI